MPNFENFFFFFFIFLLCRLKSLFIPERLSKVFLGGPGFVLPVGLLFYFSQHHSFVRRVLLHWTHKLTFYILHFSLLLYIFIFYSSCFTRNSAQRSYLTYFQYFSCFCGVCSCLSKLVAQLSYRCVLLLPFSVACLTKPFHSAILVFWTP